MYDDERGAPRQPVDCQGCGARVLVRKNSLAHTAVQWTTAADNCRARQGGSGVPAVTCTFLRDSIEAAVRTGRLEVAEPGPYAPSPLPISGNPSAGERGQS